MTNWLTEREYENAYDSADFSMKAEEEDVIIEMTKPARRKHTVTSRVINHKHKAKMVRMFDRNSDGYYSLSLYHYYRPNPDKPGVIKHIHGKFNRNIWSGHKYNEQLKKTTKRRVRRAKDEDICCTKSFAYNRKAFAIWSFD